MVRFYTFMTTTACIPLKRPCFPNFLSRGNRDDTSLPSLLKGTNKTILEKTTVD